MATTAAYQDRKEALAETGTCIRPGCDARALDDSAYCQPHLDAERAYKRTWIAKERKRRRKERLCIDCQRPRKDDERTWCTACRIRRVRLNAEALKIDAVGVEIGVEKSERIAARTVKEADGRTRYRGQSRRGQQTHAQLNMQDLGWARDSFEAFCAGVKLLSSDEAKEWRREERAQVTAATANQGERSGRHVDDILERLGHFKQRHGRRDE